jgi:hypothetical protein
MSKASSGPFQPAKTKITIATVNTMPVNVIVTAQFNPKELQIDQNVPWKKPEAANQTGSQAQGAGGSTTGGSAGANKPSGSDPNEDGMALEFTGAEGRTMTIELLFDGVEGRVDVAKSVADLVTLTRVMQPENTDETKRTPPLCLVTWGSTLPAFRCVVENLSVKYTMFSNEGAPLRATCTVKLKEAERISKDAKKGAGAGSGSGAR